jgi:hypothetical protein
VDRLTGNKLGKDERRPNITLPSPGWLGGIDSLGVCREQKNEKEESSEGNTGSIQQSTEMH